MSCTLLHYVLCSHKWLCNFIVRCIDVFFVLIDFMTFSIAKILKYSKYRTIVWILFFFIQYVVLQHWHTLWYLEDITIPILEIAAIDHVPPMICQIKSKQSSWIHILVLFNFCYFFFNQSIIFQNKPTISFLEVSILQARILVALLLLPKFYWLSLPEPAQGKIFSRVRG